MPVSEGAAKKLKDASGVWWGVGSVFAVLALVGSVMLGREFGWVVGAGSLVAAAVVIAPTLALARLMEILASDRV
jgi:hypothetical protein